MKPASERAKELMDLIAERNGCSHLYGREDAFAAITEARREAYLDVLEIPSQWVRAAVGVIRKRMEEVCGK